MKIKLTTEPPCDGRHGLSRGRVFEVVEVKPPQGTKFLKRGGWWVMGDLGKRVLVLSDEAYQVGDDNGPK